MVVYVAPNQNLTNYDARANSLVDKDSWFGLAGVCTIYGCNRDLPTWTKSIQYPKIQNATFAPRLPSDY